jgi:molybdate transport system ATP-binding protein
MNLRLLDIHLSLGDFTLAIDVAFERPITGIFGPSGAGKTTLLDVIAGLRRPNTGRIELEDRAVFDAATHLHLPPRLRRIGYVPQDLALFPHLKVRANLAYGCRRNGADGELFSMKHVSEVMEITPLLERNATTLSGGEQQRVAFARAILSAPRLLLLDEPMSSLDSRLKKRLIPFLLRIRDEFQIPLVYVTHDAAELSALCDEVIVLERGRLVARSAPEELLAD